MPLFFVHIPKTAGTSFRRGAERHFSAQRLVYDYGSESATTSSLVKSSLYDVEQPDFWQFQQALAAQDAAMLAGHVPAERFVSLLGVENTLTFVRDPLQRIASEYAHFVRRLNYQGSFQEFYTHPRMHNRQPRLLKGVNLEAFGMVGVTERYDESLEMLNACFDTRIPKRKDNQGKGFLQKAHVLEQADIDELMRLNKREIRLYRQAMALFDARYALFKAGQPWAHARLAEASTQHINGWAWWAGSERRDTPVDVELWVNGTLADSLVASDFRPSLCRWLPPRGGYVGFEFSVNLAPGDQVQCRVAATGQWFPHSPQQVKVKAT